MQLVHSLTFTGLVVLGVGSALFHYREKPHRDVAIASAVLATVSALKLVDPSYKESAKVMSKDFWEYLRTFKSRIQ